MEDSDNRIEFQMEYQGKVHNLVRSFNNQKSSSDINMAADLGLLACRNGAMSKLKNTHVRRAMNAANRISKLTDVNPHKIGAHRQSVSNIPNLPDFSTGERRKHALENSSSTPLVEIDGGNKYVSKALKYADQLLILGKHTHDDLSTEDDSATKPKKFLEIDRFIKSYRKSNVKGKKVPSYDDVQLEIFEMEKRRERIQKSRQCSLSHAMAKSQQLKWENELGKLRDEIQEEPADSNRFTFKRKESTIHKQGKPKHSIGLPGRKVNMVPNLKFPLSIRPSHKLKGMYYTKYKLACI